MRIGVEHEQFMFVSSLSWHCMLRLSAGGGVSYLRLLTARTIEDKDRLLVVRIGYS